LSDKISVIVINWNGKRFLSGCLNGLRRQAYQEFSVILIDNGSNDGSVSFVTQNYPEVRTIALSNNLGFAAANNLAFKTVQTKYVALLNNDAVPHPLWLQGLVRALDSHPHAGFAASKILFHHNHEIIDRVGDAYTKAGAGFLRGRGEPAHNFDKQEWVFGACAGAALYRTQMLKDVGLFDEDFFLLYEDVDLSFRAQLKGYKCIYVPEAIVYHNASSSILYDSPISVYYSHRNLEWVYLKNMPSRLIFRSIWLHIIYDIAALIYFTGNRRKKDFLKAKWDALREFKKILKKRKPIQRYRRVDDFYIWDLLVKESFFPRLTRRLKRS